MKYNTLNNWWVIIFILVIFSCQKKVTMDLTKESVLPKPSSVSATNSSFELKANTSVYYSSADMELKKVKNPG